MSDTPDKLCWLCKKNPTARTTGTRGYSTSLCAACKSKLNGSVGVDSFETSRPLTEIEYEQRGRIARLERELAAVTAQRDALWGALRWLCWDDCSPCATAFRDCPRYLDAIESDTVTPQP